MFVAFREQDSGCVSYGVRLASGERWFVKEAATDGARTSLARGWAFHQAVQHPAIVPQVHRISVTGGFAVVIPWHEGEVLYHPTTAGPAVARAVTARWRVSGRCPVPDVLLALEQVLDAHLAVENAGFVAADFYDGCILYDFMTGQVRLCDLDDYRPGPFTVEGERMPGSKRFMAPEEFQHGAEINCRTTVFNLGRAIRLLLDAGDTESQWRGTAAQLAVVAKATKFRPERRFGSVDRLVAAWRAVSPPSG